MAFKMKPRPWMAYAARIVCCILMFGCSYALLGGSTFALRMRDDAPIMALVIGLSAFLAFMPLLFGKRYLGALVASGFIIAGIGAYWWTSIPWDELIKDSKFPTQQKPRLLDYALVASPAVVIALYAVVSRPSMVRADLKARGADPDEISRAACAGFLSGAALLVFCGALSVAFWALMASGLPFRAFAPMPVGLPALILVATLVVVAYALLARRLPRFRVPAVRGRGLEAARDKVSRRKARKATT